MDKYYHIARDGRKIAFSDLTDRHVLNIIKLIDSSAQHMLERALSNVTVMDMIEKLMQEDALDAWVSIPVNGEMADRMIEEEIQLMMDIDTDISDVYHQEPSRAQILEFLHARMHRKHYMAEAKRRGLDIYLDLDI